MDREPLFDVSALTDYQLGHFEFLANSPSFVDIIRPFLEKREQELITLARDTREERKRKYSDAMLIERANAIGEFLAFFDEVIAGTQMERIHRSRVELSQEEQYAAIRESGGIGPAGQHKLDDGYPADEEF